jgi:hypothetical protein
MNDFDELLDGILREDAAAQPRGGLEARLMARVAAGHPRPRWRFMAWGALAAALPLCVVALLVWPTSVPPVQHVKEISAIKEASAVSGSAVPKRVAMKLERNQIQRVDHAESSVRPQSARVVYQAKSLPKLDIFPTPSMATEPEQKLAEISRQRPGVIVPDGPEAAVERKTPAPLKIESIEIAAIEIAPLYPVKDIPAKEVQGR